MLSADTNYELFLPLCSLSRPDELQEGESRGSFASVGPPSRKAEDFLFNARAGSRQGNRALQVIAPPQVKRFVLRVTRQPDRTSEGKTCGESWGGGAALLLVGCSLICSSLLCWRSQIRSVVGEPTIIDRLSQDLRHIS